MKLNLGSGDTHYDGFLNVDTNPMYKADYDFNIDERWPLEDNSVTEIKAYHILEHCKDIFHIMKEMHRVCCKNAVIDVKVPHPRHDYYLGDPGHITTVTIESMKRFDQSSETSLMNYGVLYGIDFNIFWHQYILEPFFEEQFKTLSDDQCNMMARMYNNVIQEIHFKMRVVK